MRSVFNSCNNLKYLDLSNFDTTKVTDFTRMFFDCAKLIFLNINSFKLWNMKANDGIFTSISSKVKYCINDTYSKNLLKLTSECDDICFKENINIDINNKKCIESCKDINFIYEYNRICYEDCPEDTYPFSSNNIRNEENEMKCFDKTPEGHYFDENTKNYKKCYENCKFCFGPGKIENNNCKECISNFSFLNESQIINNCYEVCNYFYYFDESNTYHCNETCQGKYNKYLLDKNKCIDNCTKDDIYQYEYNNTCYMKCPNGTYELENNKNYQCYNEAPDGYFLDTTNNIFKRCYKTCSKCKIGGNETNNNCLECISNFKFYNNSINITNCYEICEHYYFFNESNNFHCTNTCGGYSNKLIIDKKKCIDDCKKDDGNKYEFNNNCYKNCPNGTYVLEDKNDYICLNGTQDGYFLDLDNSKYKKCYDTCNKCISGGNETNNNCLECKSNYKLYINNMNISNCYEECKYYHYFNESNYYHCTETCPEKYPKLIKDKNKCIDDCKKDNENKYEYNNTCYEKCPNNTYILEDKGDFLCLNETPDSYYLDNENKIYKKCYKTCNKCKIGGNETNNNCLECKDKYKFYNNSVNISNCYRECPYFYFLIHQIISNAL